MFMAGNQNVSRLGIISDVIHCDVSLAVIGQGQDANRGIRILLIGSLQSNSYCADGHYDD
jgi:hypothetical protein